MSHNIPFFLLKACCLAPVPPHVIRQQLMHGANIVERFGKKRPSSQGMIATPSRWWAQELRELLTRRPRKGLQHLSGDPSSRLHHWTSKFFSGGIQLEPCVRALGVVSANVHRLLILICHQHIIQMFIFC